MVNSTDKVHTFILDESTTTFTTGARIFLPEFGILKDKIVTKLQIYIDAQQGIAESFCLTLRNDKDQNILVDYPVQNLLFDTNFNALNRRYISYFVNVNLAKSFLRSFDPLLSLGGSIVYFTVFYRDNK